MKYFFKMLVPILFFCPFAFAGDAHVGFDFGDDPFGFGLPADLDTPLANSLLNRLRRAPHFALENLERGKLSEAGDQIQSYLIEIAALRGGPIPVHLGPDIISRAFSIDKELSVEHTYRRPIIPLSLVFESQVRRLVDEFFFPKGPRLMSQEEVLQTLRKMDGEAFAKRPLLSVFCREILY